MLYSNSTADKLLACYLQKPSLMVETKFPIEKDEFQVQLHKIVFVTCYNLFTTECKSVNIMEINQWLSKYTAEYNIYKDNNGDEYVKTIIELTDVDNFEYYYTEFRKFSCLNAYKTAGFNIDKFYDETKSEESQLANLAQYTTDDIINHFEAIQIENRRKFRGSTVKEEYLAGSDFLETMERFRDTPLLGNSFQSGFLNGIFNGMYGFIIRGAKSGQGKSVLSMGDLCTATITQVYDTDKKCYVKNKSRKGNGLFINTELDLRNEVDPMIIAWISKVPRNHIIKNLYVDDEEERVVKARDILVESGLYVVDDPEFTTKSLVDTIKYYVYNYNIETVCFDYIQNNGFVAKEISNETKVPQREDMVLLALADRLKQIQRECNVSLITAIQLNGQEDTMENPNESCLAGGKATVRKTDGTMIMLYPSKKELSQTEVLISKWNTKYKKNAFGESIQPNNVIHIIKGRGSEYPKNIKVFQHVDLGTSTSIDMFCTDKDNNPIDVKNLVIEYDDQEDINDVF